MHKKEGPKSTEFSDEKYLDRKSSIDESDESIIIKSKELSGDFPQPTASATLGHLNRLSILLGDQISKYPLIDIGGGESSFSNGIYLQASSEGDYNIPKFINVEPYAESKLKEVPKDITTELVQDKRDGLSFLLDQEQESGNIMCNSINYSLIPNMNYLKRIAQETYRVIPEDGLFITTDSDDIADEAKLLFPYRIELDYTTIFSKSPLPSESIINKLTGYDAEGQKEFLRRMKKVYEKGDEIETVRNMDEVRDEIRALGFELESTREEDDEIWGKQVVYKVKKKKE